MKFSGKVGNGPVNKRLNFGGDPITDPDRYPHPGKTCLGGDTCCPSASSYYFILITALLLSYDTMDYINVRPTADE